MAVAAKRGTPKGSPTPGKGPSGRDGKAASVSRGAAASARSRALPAAELRRLDRNSEALGVPVAALMANAGRALSKAAQRMAPEGPVLLLCGPGNNGGDGLAAALDLVAAGRDAWVVLAAHPAKVKGAARQFLDQVPASRLQLWTGRPDPSWTSCSLVVDCLLGTGVSSPTLRPPYPDLVRWVINQRAKGTKILSCDVPTGLGTKTAVRPHATVTFHAAKPGMTRANSGHIEVVDIGIPAAAADIGPGDLEAAYRVPEQDSHKGDNGTILLVAGSIPYTGAPRYAAMGAYRTGADLVHALLPARAAGTLRALGPEPVVHDGNPGDTLAPEAAQPARRLLAKSDALLIGPGLGPSTTTQEAAHLILQQAATARVPCVVDADGLDAVTAQLLRRHGRQMVLTPHAGEFHDLSGKPATAANVEAYARRHGVVVLCKGRKGAPGEGYATLVTDGHRTRECRRGHPTMTVGGTGDVLAGTVAALMAKGAAPFEAACGAAYLVGASGEVAASLRSYGATATDLHEAIPRILLELD